MFLSRELIMKQPKNGIKILLIESDQLSLLMIHPDLGVSTPSRDEVKRFDYVYFGEE